MKIWLAALDAHGGGGITTHLTNITKGLNDVGHEVRWITPIGNLVQDISSLALALNREHFPSYVHNSAVELLETLAVNLEMNFSLLLREEKPDILHCHDVITFNRIKNIAASYSVPVVLTTHGYIAEEEVANGNVQKDSLEHKYWLKTEWYSLKEAHFVCPVGTELANYLHSIFPTDRMQVIANPLHKSFLQRNVPNVREKIGIPEEAFLIFCPSRFAFNKGVEFLVQALDQLTGNLVLLLVDHGMKELQYAIENSSSSEKIRVAKPFSREEISSIYAASNVCVIPSVTAGNSKETSSYTAMEAMVLGTPVIASNIGGLKEVIGNAGVLVPERSVDHLAASIQKLMNDKQEYNRMATLAKERGKQFFTDAIVPKLVDIYQKAINQGGYPFYTSFSLYGFSPMVVRLVFLMILGDYKGMEQLLRKAEIRFGTQYKTALLTSFVILCKILPKEYETIKESGLSYLQKLKK